MGGEVVGVGVAGVEVAGQDLAMLRRFLLRSSRGVVVVVVGMDSRGWQGEGVRHFLVLRDLDLGLDLGL